MAVSENSEHTLNSVIIYILYEHHYLLTSHMTNKTASFLLTDKLYVKCVLKCLFFQVFLSKTLYQSGVILAFGHD